MSKATSELTRRRFLQTGIAAASAAALPRVALYAEESAAAYTPQQSRAKYTRYNVTSEQGQKALRSYAKGVEAMLNLPASNPQNWFRNSFVHFMDCPHGNWWFYVWHRGYLGYFEETIRNLSGDPTFAIPYWDWTTLPEVPESMFDGPLTPMHAVFEPYTRNLNVFTNFIQSDLQAFFNSLSSAQRAQLNTRGYSSFDLLWNDVTGYTPSLQAGISGNMAYAITCGSRYLTRNNRKLTGGTLHDVSPEVIIAGLAAPDFYNGANPQLSFNSSKTASHVVQPGSGTFFSILEGLPHNNVHNFIGGVGAIDPGPYGNMTNFLSPVDPVFFLHHSNMDRLWDAWTRKQKEAGRPYLPTGSDLPLWANEPFLFYVNGNGQFVGPSKAADYESTDRFQYDYQPGFGAEHLPAPAAGQRPLPHTGVVSKNTASVPVPTDAIQKHLAATAPSLAAVVTIPQPNATSTVREFDVLVGAPANETQVGTDSPYYAGTIAFFGSMTHMRMGAEATFIVPLPHRPEAFKLAEGAKTASVNIRVVPSHGFGVKAPALKAASVRAL